MNRAARKQARLRLAGLGIDLFFKRTKLEQIFRLIY
jgi:hypothetical protein